MNALDSAIYSKLQSTSGLTSLLAGTTSIYSVQAPENATLPYVVFNVQGGGDDNETAHRTKNLVVFIRGYAEGMGAKKTAGSIDAAIDTALHLSSFTVSGWSNFWLAREEDLETVENPPSGSPIFMVGGLYRVRIEKT